MHVIKSNTTCAIYFDDLFFTMDRCCNLQSYNLLEISCSFSVFTPCYFITFFVIVLFTAVGVYVVCVYV